MYLLIGTTVVRVIGTYDTPEIAAAVVEECNAPLPPSPEPIRPPVVDLMAALEKSLEAARERVTPNPHRVDV